MGQCCSRHGQTIVPDTNVAAKLCVYTSQDAASQSISKDLANTPTRFPIAQQVQQALDEPIDVPNITNPSVDELGLGMDEVIEAPYKLDFSTSLTEQQKEGKLLQEKRQVNSQCSIVSIQRLTSPLSYCKESESSFDSEVEDKQLLGSSQT